MSFFAEIIWKNCKVRPKYKAELCSFRTLGVRTWQFILHMFIWRIKQSCWKGFELCNFPNFAVPNFAVSTVTSCGHKYDGLLTNPLLEMTCIFNDMILYKIIILQITEKINIRLNDYMMRSMMMFLTQSMWEVIMFSYKIWVYLQSTYFIICIWWVINTSWLLTWTFSSITWLC